MKAKHVYSLIVSAVLSLSTPALAQDESTHWQDLSAEQQQILTPYAESWAAISPERQSRLAAGANRWLEMAPGGCTEPI